jgi:hypothetical protein
VPSLDPKQEKPRLFATLAHFFLSQKELRMQEPLDEKIDLSGDFFTTC